jgi:K+-sensing histidine kinase KdpD
MDAATDQAETFPAGTMTGQVNRTFPLDEQVAAVAARKSLREAIADYASDPATLDVQVAELRKRVAGMENAIAHAEHFIAQDRLTRLREIALSSAVSHTNQGRTPPPP